MHGIVLERDQDDRIRIQLESEHEGDQTCSACHLKDSCDLTRTRLLELNRSDIDIDLNPGDEVQIEMQARHVVLLSFSIYIIPLILMIVLGSIGNRFSQFWTILLSFSGLGIGILFNVVLNRVLSVRRILTVTSVGPDP